MATLRELLDTELSPENVCNMTANELALKLVDYGIFETVSDVNMMVIEGIQKAINDDDEFPVHYYSKDEKMHEDGKYVSPQPSLTDDYIKNELS